MNNDNASPASSISVQALSVTLRREYTRVRSLREYVVGSLKGWIRDAQWFEALSDVSFSVAPGELFAVLGPNGAGKTTLLRVLAGIIPPTRGLVRVEGRTAPLIELGAGFDPELTGHENVFLYGSLLGMSRQALRDGLAEIVAFSGLDSVMEVAVKNYSSGMIGRLGFAVATAAQPRVLLVDEVLAVGDEQFRAQCFSRIDALLDRGSAVVLVSHDLSLVGRLAKRGLLLDSSRVVACGSLGEVVEVYRQRAAE